MTNWETELFFRSMLGEVEIKTEKGLQEVEAGYFAMCLLLPEESFIRIVNSYGGLEKVQSDQDSKNTIAKIFRVQPRLVDIRVNQLLSDQKEEKLEHKKKNLVKK